MKTTLTALALLVAAGCVSQRPVHPYRLDGFPGAPIEGDLFPMRGGARWVFRDRLGGADTKPLELALQERNGGLVLEGSRQGGAAVALEDGFLTIRYEGEVVDQPLKLEGHVGDRWAAAGARYTVFGYDRVEVLGKEHRALVVAAERGQTRDLYWFADGVGWIRMRTERQGKALRDAFLEEFRPGGAS